MGREAAVAWLRDAMIQSCAQSASAPYGRQVQLRTRFTFLFCTSAAYTRARGGGGARARFVYALVSSLLCFDVSALTTGRAWAEPLQAAPLANAQAVELARRYFLRGTDASKLGHWVEARAAFKRSLEYIAKPSALFNLAVADVQLGLGEEALEVLATFSRLATEREHAQMIARAQLLQSLATALVQRQKSTALSDTELLDVPDLGGQALDTVTQAIQLYLSGDLDHALPLLEEAYDLTHRPEILFNIGLAADRLGARERAILAYKAFAAALPDTPQAATARARLLLLGEYRSEVTPPVALEPAPRAPLAQNEPSAVPPSRKAEMTGGHSAELPQPSKLRLVAPLAAGVGLMAASVGTGLWSVNRAAEREHCRSDAPSGYECTSAHSIERQYRASIATTASLLGLAVPLTLWGVVNWVRRPAAAVKLHAGCSVWESDVRFSARITY